MDEKDENPSLASFIKMECSARAYCLIDTLDERLYEGCEQSYILKLDRRTTFIDYPMRNSVIRWEVVAKPEESGNNGGEEEVVCKGKESYKEYIKRFFAAITIREIQIDIKNGLMDSTPLHH
ncbi:structural maintenance of chromosomes flexible hinge domain protein [Thalictrum thalictroides]|uniref:Structural maintenance of chromosomes flexible hinge domain protein n=1 Tax=Thalictrum thalictroides TaxID=46969 RepID=A0A7J6XGB1_THATH|nr:structural maintenance of chromosomes flexible hinge domain protein [Thalictrum thalictroides]